MKVVIFEQENVKIKRKKAQPSKDYSTIGHNDNKVVVMIEDGKAYLKVLNPLTGLSYIYSHIQSYTNPDVNRTDSRGVHAILLETSLKPEPSPYLFIFKEESAASKFYACVFFAVKAAKADELSYDAETVANNSDYDAETIANNSEEESVSSSESFNSFNPTQDFNVGAQALAQELLASYK